MKALEGGFIQPNLCNSICSVLGQGVNGKALGTYIWKQHVSKGFINPVVKAEKEEEGGKKKQVEKHNYGGWEKTIKRDQCRFFSAQRKTFSNVKISH